MNMKMCPKNMIMSAQHLLHQKKISKQKKINFIPLVVLITEKEQEFNF